MLWEHDGVINHIILDFVRYAFIITVLYSGSYTDTWSRLDKAHTGVYLVKKMAECLIGYGTRKRVLTVTCDNANNNSTMMTHLETLVPQIRGLKVHVWCMAHIINLVVKVHYSVVFVCSINS